MIVFTHLLFSKVLYRYYSKEVHCKLDKNSFMFGNIKPDICHEYSKYPHSIDDTLNVVSELSNQLILNKHDKKYCSMVLGMISHYVCDYFCLYHTKSYVNKKILGHFIYETRLHIQLITLLMKRKLNFISDQLVSKKNPIAIIFEEQTKYKEQKDSIHKDINFALSTASTVLQSIMLYSTNTFMDDLENMDYYQLPNAVGGMI